jgi:hypothetical protein
MPEYENSAPVQLQPGLELTGIDFRLRTIPVVRVSGQVTGPDPSATQAYTYRLIPDGIRNQSHEIGGSADRDRFEFGAVRPGSYVLVAYAISGTLPYIARVPVHVTDGDVEDLVVPMRPAIDIPGRIRVEGDPLRVTSVRLLPAEAASHPQTGLLRAVPSGSSFLLPRVIPGTYKLVVDAEQAYYFKSVTVGGRPMQPSRVAVGDGPLEIVLSTKIARVSGTTDGEPGTAVVLLGEGGPRLASSGADGTWRIESLAPGNYHVAAVAGFDEVMSESLELLEAVRERGQLITVEEGGTALVHAPTLVIQR